MQGTEQSIFSLAEDNDLIVRSPIRKRHKPVVQRSEKPIWTPETVRKIIEAVPKRGSNRRASWRASGPAMEGCGPESRHAPSRAESLEGTTCSTKDGGERSDDPARCQMLSLHAKNSNRVGPEDFVFCKADGKPFNPDVLRKDILYPVLDRRGVPDQPGRQASTLSATRLPAS